MKDLFLIMFIVFLMMIGLFFIKQVDEFVNRCISNEDCKGVEICNKPGGSAANIHGQCGSPFYNK